MLKTPDFDKALDEILNNLKPHKKTCQQCDRAFDIFQKDIGFYKMLRVSSPKLCPDCRLQRRLAWRINFLPIFYKKSCSAPGHNEKIITFYSEENPVKVFDDEYYLSDAWEPFDYGRDYDFSQSFFEQFNEFSLKIPHQSLQKDPESINCDYVVSGASSKNCYYVAVPYRSENVYYAYLPSYSRDCLDVNCAHFCEKCYGSSNLDHCYNCNFCRDCLNCLDCCFLFDCKNCQNCFSCFNLRNKKYYFFNQPLTKEEYQKRIKEINLGKRSVVREYQSKFEKLSSRAIRKNLNNIKEENSLGNDLKECRNCFYVFYALKSENLRYMFGAKKCSDTMDFLGGVSNSLCYDSTGVVSGNNIKFSVLIRTGLGLEYCIECNNCQYCFGCFGLKNKKFCLFNKQYSESEYWHLVDKIKTQMLRDGEYGEFFPLKYSPFPYYDSNAQIEFPLTKEEIIKCGWRWQEEVESEIDLSKFKLLIKAEQIPDDIKDVSDDILNSVIICEQTGKPFRLIKFELDFYRKKNLPLPTIHPFQRIKNSSVFRHPYRLWQYPCSRCGKTMYSGWDPAKKYKVYCEACYLAEVV